MVYWFISGIFGIAYGIVLQRSGFCFSKAVFEMFLLRSRDALNGILFGMLVATFGFGAVVLIRDSFGLDVRSHLLLIPLGINTVIGGVLFGTGMTLAGMCAAGTLHRLGEGYAIAWATLAGAVVGTAVNPLRSLFSTFETPRSSAVWLGGIAGVIPACLLTAAALAIFWWLISGRFVCTREPDHSRWDSLKKQVFLSPAVIGGVLLGGINVLQMAATTPWTVTYPLSLVPPSFEGSSGSISSALPYIILNAGVVLGVIVSSAFSRTLRFRRPHRFRDVVPVFAGGILMGWGVQLAQGCSIGGAFSAIPSLSLSGWVFFPALCLGGWIGTRILRVWM